MTSAKRWSIALLLALGVSVGCAQLIGADDPRELRRSQIVSSEDAFAPVPDAAVDAEACGPSEKRCDNRCVSKTDPTYGCNDPGCAPCNMPNAKTIACSEVDGKCIAGTCNDGYSYCSQAHEGCKFDFTDPATCGDCGTNCNNGPKPLCTKQGCSATCPPDTTQCGSSCVDTQTHPKYCGSCTNACVAGANGDPGCADAKCLTICRPGFGHCDGNPNGNCVALQTFYADNDGDGYGDSNGIKKQACPGQGGPGFAPVAGDCFDGSKEVFPGQPAMFAVPYKTPGGGLSYDYDCNGIEQDRGAHFPGCDSKCGGSGIGPAGSGRTGPAVNDYCGSTKAFSCAGGLSPVEPATHFMASSGGQELTPACSIEAKTIEANGCH